MGKVRAVLFDLDHTLFDTEKTERRALKSVAMAASVRLSAQVLGVYQSVNTHVWGEYRAGRITSKELRVLRFHMWLERMDLDPAPARTLAPLYLEAFSSRADLIPGASATVRGLSRLGLRLGVVTNGIDRVQRRRLKAGDLYDAFPVIVTSERAGVAKPDPRILEIALGRLRARPEEAVYVGDDPQVDGLAANRARVPFVWFNPRKAPLRPNPRVVIDHQVAHLREIRGLF